MKRNLLTLSIVVASLVFALLLFTFQVRQTEVAVVTTFGQPTRPITQPGLYFKLPRPFQRIRPAYPNSAAIADAEATVDVIVDIDSKGEVKHAEVDRWAGFGLDEASLQTVEHMHFFPALRNRVPIPMRVLLRYNFRKPAN
jgi:TonB family protein